MGLKKQDVPLDLFMTLDKIWNDIAPDLSDGEDFEGMTNLDVIQTCLDADRLDILADRKDLQEWVNANNKAGNHRELLHILSMENRYV